MAELAPTEAEGEYRLGYAGDTFNTAWYLARCARGVSVSYLTAVGNDAISRGLTVFMRSSGIDDRFVRIAPDRSIGLYLISLDRGERSFAYWRDRSAARTLADDSAFLSGAMAASDMIYFSGITLAILPPEKRATLLTTLADARRDGKTIAFDPNLRPRLWESNEVMTAAIMDGAAASDIVLPSYEDEADWFGDVSPRATLERYAAAGATTVVVKNGAAPVLYADRGETGEVSVDPLEEVTDTTAAGDSFNAGILAGLAADHALADGIAYACALSRKVVQHKGALVETGLPAPIGP
ncbi:sugar kinase [Jannaschia sp. S6380]|nr:sugar kinase [Jannaschia sp. S6380]